MLSVAKQDMDKGFQMVLKYKPTIDFILGNGHTPLLAMVVAGASHMVKLLVRIICYKTLYIYVDIWPIYYHPGSMCI